MVQFSSQRDVGTRIDQRNAPHSILIYRVEKVGDCQQHNINPSTIAWIVRSLRDRGKDFLVTMTENYFEKKSIREYAEKRGLKYTEAKAMLEPQNDNAVRVGLDDIKSEIVRHPRVDMMERPDDLGYMNGSLDADTIRSWIPLLDKLDSDHWKLINGGPGWNGLSYDDAEKYAHSEPMLYCGEYEFGKPPEDVFNISKRLDELDGISVMLSDDAVVPNFNDVSERLKRVGFVDDGPTVRMDVPFTSDVEDRAVYLADILNKTVRALNGAVFIKAESGSFIGFSKESTTDYFWEGREEVISVSDVPDVARSLLMKHPKVEDFAATHADENTLIRLATFLSLLDKLKSDRWELQSGNGFTQLVLSGVDTDEKSVIVGEFEDGLPQVDDVFTIDGSLNEMDGANIIIRGASQKDWLNIDIGVGDNDGIRMSHVDGVGVRVDVPHIRRLSEPWIDVLSTVLNQIAEHV